MSYMGHCTHAHTRHTCMYTRPKNTKTDFAGPLLPRQSPE